MPIPGITSAPLLINHASGGLPVSDLFNISLWAGTNAARTITTGIDSGEGSLVWVKVRDEGSTPHVLYDSLRGTSSSLSTNTGNAASTNSDRVTSFLSTGYSLGTNGAVNYPGYNYVGWQFRRAPKFFDIVQYTGNGVSGRTITHNLGVKPGLLVVKNISTNTLWIVQHITLGASYASLNTADAFFSAAPPIFPSAATEDHFEVGSNPTVNDSGNTYIAYLFAHDSSPAGLIQCGSYVGNGSTTGPVINLGWRPQYLMIKNATATGDWQIIDSSRGFTAANDAILLANTSVAETSANLVNPNSTGFQLASAASNVNTNGQTYIYIAVREA